MEYVIDPKVIQWLASLGYNLKEKPAEDVAAMFIREARQWQLPPDELACMIKEESSREDSPTCLLHA